MIANLKAQVERKNKMQREWYKKKGIKPPVKKRHLQRILEGKSSLRLGRILKVKNRQSGYSRDYCRLILVMNKKNQVVYVINVSPDGIGTGGISLDRPSDGGLTKLLWSKHKVLNILSLDLGRTVSRGDVKQMERVGFQFPLGPLWAPMWEIILKDGSLYYYSILTDLVYIIENRIPWEKGDNGVRERPQKLVPAGTNDYVTDTVNDEILVLKVI